MTGDVTIRNERPEDYRKVEELTRLAFWNLNAPGCDEHYLVHVMRSHADFIPELDMVMELDGQIIGNIMYTKAWLQDAGGRRKEIVSFGPLSIHPACQRKGYGKALLEHSLQKAAALGYDAVVIFGNPGNYIPRGFISCKKCGVHLENGVYPTALLVLELKQGVLAGQDWSYIESEAYALDQSKAEAFDRQFPPAKKEHRPSQEEFYIYSHSQIF